jgi:fucose permease
MTAMAALQAFFFLPAQRFKTVLVDFPALLVIGLGIGALVTKPRL